MATITTAGTVTSLLETDPLVFDLAANNVAPMFAESFVTATYDLLYYANYSSPPISNTEYSTYLYGASGNVSLLGSGFLGSSGTITQMQFTGDSGLDWDVTGAIRWNVNDGVTSIHMHSYNAAYAGDQVHMAGNLTMNNSGVSGSVSQVGVTTLGMTMAYTGSISLATGAGRYKSIDLYDASGNAIRVQGSFQLETWDNELAVYSTIDDLFDSPILLAGSDTFNVADAARIWHGYGGSDKLYGGSLNDELHGDDGNDKLYGYGGNDILVGGSGNDQMDGGEGDDTLLGGAGNDKITDLFGNNSVTDDLGNANITVGDGNDSITTAGGNDKIVAGGGNNQIDAGDGNNKVVALAGDDSIISGSGNDNINAGDGNNTISAGTGNNRIVTGSGVDSISSGAGNDNITAGACDNQIEAGDGNDKIVTLSGNDIVSTGAGNDNVNAGDGNNTIDAGAGNDRVVSGSGDDIINGGDGADKLTGGLGSDSFIFDNLAQGGLDTVTDFQGLDDLLIFEASVFASLAGGISTDNLVVGSGATAVAQDSDDFLIFNASTGWLYYDADGNDVQAAVPIVKLLGVTSLDASSLSVDL